MNFKYLLFLMVVVLAAACGGDDEPDIPSDRIILSYDGPNVTAPTFPAGLYEFAVRFPSMLTGAAEGRSIEQVTFYLYEAPAEMYINISTDVTPTLPGEILNTQRVSGLTTNAWNTVTLNEPFFLDGSPVWVGIEVNQNSNIQTVGCDAGPANPNGDWLYDEENMEWETFFNRTSESVRWNIKAILSE